MKRKCICCGKVFPADWIKSIEQFREVCTDCATSTKSTGKMNKIGGEDCVNGMVELAGAVISLMSKRYKTLYMEAINEAYVGGGDKAFREFKELDETIHGHYYYVLSLGMIDSVARTFREDIDKQLPEGKRKLARKITARLQRR